MTAPSTPGQWLDAMLGTPATLARIETHVERLITMAGESQAALAELGAAITAEMEQFATRQEQLETQVRGLLDQLQASQQQVDSLDLTIAHDIRAAIPRIQGIIPDDDPGAGEPVAARGQVADPSGGADPTDTATTASPVGEVVAGTPQGDTGGATPPEPAPVQVDPRADYTIPRSADDGRDLGEADRPFTYDTGEHARGANRLAPQESGAQRAPDGAELADPAQAGTTDPQ